jgi:hypothetical protein
MGQIPNSALKVKASPAGVSVFRPPLGFGLASLLLFQDGIMRQIYRIGKAHCPADIEKIDRLSPLRGGWVLVMLSRRWSVLSRQLTGRSHGAGCHRACRLTQKRLWRAGLRAKPSSSPIHFVPPLMGSHEGRYRSDSNRKLAILRLRFKETTGAKRRIVCAHQRNDYSGWSA